MSKALVIKGANFLANKVDTVTLSEVVPCESVTLSESAISFTAIGATEQLTATVLPVDTTETLVWSSSDENCATVADGLVTCVGVGTATITAMCGEQSATCTVTATVTIDAATLEVLHRRSIQSTDLTTNPPKNYVGIANESTSKSGTNADRSRTYASGDSTLGYYKAFSVAGLTEYYPIPIPQNASEIQINCPDFKNACYMALLDGFEKSTYTGIQIDSRGAKAMSSLLSQSNVIESTTSGWKLSLEDYTDFNSFVFSIRAASGNDEEAITSAVSIVFS